MHRKIIEIIVKNWGYLNLNALSRHIMQQEQARRVPHKNKKVKTKDASIRKSVHQQ
jgi:hypothetical protein